MTDLATLQGWLDRYIKAWRSNDRDTIAALFTEDATYRYSPFEKEPLRGRAQIVDSWLEEPDDPDSWQMRAEPLAVKGDLGVARGWTTYAATDSEPEREYSNIYVVRLTDDGRCAELTEWYMKRPDAAASGGAGTPPADEAPAL